MLAAAPGVPFGRYLLLERLAVGGMAEVWLASAGDEGGKPVVLKRILPQFAADPEFTARFREEATLSLSLLHGNIVPVFEVGTVGEETFIAMEYVPGVDLRGILRAARAKGIRPPPGIAAWILAEVLRGLDYAHRKTDADGRPLLLVHRDVSPSNVVVSREGTVKLLDFGIAKAFGREATRTGVLRGKVGYMSPEQARGEPITAASDLFSAGVVLFELLTAERLFDGESEPAVLEQVKSRPIPRVRDRAPDVPPALDEIVARALERAPESRFGSAAEFHDALARLLVAGTLAGSAPATGSFVAELVPDAAAPATPSAGDGEGEERTATRAPAAAQIGPANPLVLGGAMAAPASPVAAAAPHARAPAPAVAARNPLAWALGGAALALAIGIPLALGVLRAGRGDASGTPAPSEGAVFVDSTVRGSAILVDGVDTARVTPALVTAPIGPHRITVRRRGYADRELPQEFGRTPAEQHVVQTPAVVRLAVETTPPGAIASVPGHGSCGTPCAFDGLLATDTVTVTASKPGYRAATTTVALADVTGPVSLALESESRPATPRASAAPLATAAVVAVPGHVSFAARPWAFLWIDDGAKSDKPLMRVALPPGRHVLHVQNEALKVALQCPFDVGPGETRELVTLRLADGDARCPVESPPSNGHP